MKILFVCTGNSCRSPMAEAYLQKICKENGRNDLEISSCGLSTIDGMNASVQAQVVMQKFGADLNKFKSRRATLQIIENADLIVAMTMRHKEKLADSGADTAKIRLLLEFDGQNQTDVPDPFGENVAGYLDCFNKMQPALDKMLKSIKH